MKLNSVEFVTSVANVVQLTNKIMPEIAFAGRSNVGKSSLINCLLNRKKIAKISSTPGKTRLLNYFVINYFVSMFVIIRRAMGACICFRSTDGFNIRTVIFVFRVTVIIVYFFFFVFGKQFFKNTHGCSLLKY